MAKIERNSAHELLRIVAMFFIVWYHLALYWMQETPQGASMGSGMKVFLPTLHIGVILFLLITGYYGIKPSISGFMRLLFITAIYFLPVEIIRCVHHHGNILGTLMFITNTPYWFVRTYLFFYLVSPIVNRFIDTSSQRQNNYMIMALAVISIYFGTTGGDGSLMDGKNLVHFTFLYFLGHAIRQYQPQWERLGKLKLFMMFVLLNIVLIGAMVLTCGYPTIREEIFNLSFPYCSPILVVNAGLLFMVFSLMQFHSKILNNIASSMFAVYIIHCHPAVHKYVLMPIIDCISTCCITPPCANGGYADVFANIRRGCVSNYDWLYRN